MKSLVIVADSSFVIETVRLALRSSAGFTVAGEVDGRGPVAAPIAKTRPDVVLVDEMEDGAQALERIRECRMAAPGAALLLLSARMDDVWVAQAIAAGADACVSKSAPLPSLGTLIREAANRNIVTTLPAGPRQGRSPLPGAEELTPREREILGLAARGHTNARIGRELWITEQTVKFHLSNVYRKLGVSNRTEASRYAHAHDLQRAA
jgi:DNA-binding NarL/FixJ family response regulator